MASGCTSQTNQTQIPTKNFSASGISFQYPDTWNLSSATNANATMITISNPEFVQTNGTKGSVILIVKAPKTAEMNMEQSRQQLLNQSKESGQNATNGSISIAGLTGTETAYTAKDTQNQTSYARLIDFEKDNMVYLLLFATGGGADIEAAKPYFDVIVKSFKIE